LLLDPNRLEVPSVVSRDKSSNRDAAGSTPDAARGVTREDKAFLEEEGLAQAASTLKKRKRVKKSPIWAGSLQRNFGVSFPQGGISGR